MTDITRITPDHIQSLIKSTDYFYHDLLTLCVITLANGFKVTGESSCVAVENYNRELGENLARTQATEKVWMLEGYLLRQRRFEKGLE